MNFIAFIILGALSGYIASRIMNRAKKGILRYLILGILGAILGGWLFSLLQIQTTGFIGELVVSVIGAMLVIFLADKLRK